MSHQPIRRIVICGGGTAGWMAAAAIGQIMGKLPGMRIELVESEEIGTVGVGEATIPQIVLFNQMLGIDEAEFIRATHATFKMGIEFVDWTRLGHSYIHPFGTYGVDMGGIEFHHHWLRARALGDMSELDDYSISAVAGRNERFMRPRRDLPNSPLSRISYAFQFDAALWARHLRGIAEGKGVVRTEGRVVRVERGDDRGHVTALHLADGRMVEGELFIDCSGFRGLLIGEAMGSPFEDWTDWLPCDRAWAVPCALGGDARPITRSTARAAGWQWRIPLQHRIGNGHVYSSTHMSDDEAVGILLANLDGEPLAEPRQLRFAAGHRRDAWVGNVVALGLAGGFLEPLESTSIHLVQAGIARLMSLFPDTGFTAPERDMFNRESRQDYVDIRDFLILHYVATERDDSPFWRSRREMTLPEGLAAKLAMFRANGRVFRSHNELFTETSWLSVMVGQGIQAGGYHPAAALLPDDETRRRVAHIRGVIADSVQQMPTQRAFLASENAVSDGAAAGKGASEGIRLAS